MRGRVLVVVVIAMVSTGCSTASTASDVSTGAPTTEAPLPAGVHPSKISRMVCGREAQREIDSALGETATVSTPTWVDHLYSCRYDYGSGSMTLSVKELSSWDQTTAYFDGLASTKGKARDLQGLGQGAFQTTDGSVVVRKDWKVLLVDIAALPSQFGVPATSSGDVAVTAADVILGCWSGD